MDYKYIVELANDTCFFWNPHKTWHGTTLSKLPCEYPDAWKSFVKTESGRRKGQVSVVFALTTAIVGASARKG
jgi:hypothetical protein